MALINVLELDSGLMSYNRFIDSMAQDFSSLLYEFDEPADTYIDPIVKVFGETPTRSSVEDALTSEKAEALLAELQKWQITVTKKKVQDILRRCIMNYFGRGK